MVTTNRRTYHLRLQSHRTDYLPKVSFTYPDEALNKWAAVRTREREHRNDSAPPGDRRVPRRSGL